MTSCLVIENISLIPCSSVEYRHATYLAANACMIQPQIEAAQMQVGSVI